MKHSSAQKPRECGFAARYCSVALPSVASNGLRHSSKGFVQRIPSAAFFKLVKKLGYSYEDEDVFVDHEIKRLYLLREDPQSLHKNRKLMWVETRSGRILTRL